MSQKHVRSRGTYFPQKIMDDVSAVLDQIWDKEMDDMVRCYKNGDSVEGHFFHTLVRVHNFVNKDNFSAEEILDIADREKNRTAI